MDLCGKRGDHTVEPNGDTMHSRFSKISLPNFSCVLMSVGFGIRFQGLTSPKQISGDSKSERMHV